MNRIDWQYLRKAMIVFLSVTIVLGGAYWFIRDHYQKADTQFSAQQRRFSDAKRRYDEARRNRAVYRQYLSEYRRYMNAGFIGEEQRLSWIEQLQQLNEQYKLESLSYEITPQGEAELPALNVPGSISLNVSTMELKAGLLHEADAISLWKDFRNHSKGFYSIKHCRLDSSGALASRVELDYSPYTSYVGMTCQLDWYTIKVAGS